MSSTRIEELSARESEEIEWLRNVAARSWDNRPCLQATEDDIDLLVLREALQRIGLHRSGNGSVEAYVSATLPLSSFVPPLLVREPLTGILRPRNFAILLFGHRVQYFIPGAISFFSSYQGTNRSVPLGERTELDGTLLTQISTMLPLVEAQAVTLYDKENLEHPSARKYPQRALREALVNAFAHRDYQRVDPLRVTAFADRVEFNSPGGLLPGIGIEELRRGEVGAIWRNQTLAWFFNRLRLAEAEGQGIETIHESMREEGCPPPEFDANENRVLCVLRAHSRSKAESQRANLRDRNLALEPEQESESVETSKNVALAHLVRLVGPKDPLYVRAVAALEAKRSRPELLELLNEIEAFDGSPRLRRALSAYLNELQDPNPGPASSGSPN